MINFWNFYVPTINQNFGFLLNKEEWNAKMNFNVFILIVSLPSSNSELGDAAVMKIKGRVQNKKIANFRTLSKLRGGGSARNLIWFLI